MLLFLALHDLSKAPFTAVLAISSYFSCSLKIQIFCLASHNEVSAWTPSSCNFWFVAVISLKAQNNLPGRLGSNSMFELLFIYVYWPIPASNTYQVVFSVSSFCAKVTFINTISLSRFFQSLTWLQMQINMAFLAPASMSLLLLTNGGRGQFCLSLELHRGLFAPAACAVCLLTDPV